MSYSLFLYPQTPVNRAITRSVLLPYLVKHELVNSAIQSEYLEPGAQLMAYINYLGCSPNLSSGEVNTTIRIHQFEQITAMGGQSVETIRYPECKHPVNDPVGLLTGIQSGNEWICPVCGNQGTHDQINWRKSAGLSTIFIEITSIFPKEALPTEKFLSLLQNFSHTRWAWFYSRSSQ